MKYIKELARPYKLKEGDIVLFNLSGGTIYKGEVSKGSGFYVNLYGNDNESIFRELGLDKDDFMQATVGYTPDGNWPEVRSLEDLEKVLDTLRRVHKPEEVEETEEKPKPPSEWDWLLG